MVLVVFTAAPCSTLELGPASTLWLPLGGGVSRCSAAPRVVDSVTVSCESLCHFKAASHNAASRSSATAGRGRSFHLSFTLCWRATVEVAARVLTASFRSRPLPLLSRSVIAAAGIFSASSAIPSLASNFDNWQV